MELKCERLLRLPPLGRQRSAWGRSGRRPQAIYEDLLRLIKNMKRLLNLTHLATHKHNVRCTLPLAATDLMALRILGD